MIPHRESLRVVLKVRGEPVGCYEEFSTPLWLGASPVEIVISQAILRDHDGVVLQADLAVIVELRHSGRIVMTLVVRLLGEQHVVFAQFPDRRIRIRGRSLVPKCEVALASEEVSAEDTPVIAEAGQAEPGWFS